MESKKSKIFTKKLIALFLSALMAATCFTGVLTAYARGEDYHDSKLAYNFLAWAEATDEQTAEAVLDWADANLDWTMKNLIGFDEYHFSQNIVVATISIDAYLDSVDGLIYTVEQADSLLDSYGGLVGGDVKNIDLSAIGDDIADTYSTSSSDVISKCGRSYRAKWTAKQILVKVAELLYDNTKDGNNVFRKLVIGDFNLGTILGGVVSNLAGSSDIFDILKDTLGMWDNYQNDLAYNVVANLIFTNTKWWDEETLNYYKQTDSNGNLKNWNFDDRLFEALSTQLMQKINAEITYTEADQAEGISLDSSKTRFAKLKAYAEDNGIAFTEENTADIVAGYNAANGTTWDPNLYYVLEDGDEQGDVRLFRYGTDKLVINKTDNLLQIAYSAAKLAWNTALKDTLGLVHVNYSNEDDTENTHGSNFDNHYYLWRSSKYGWSTANKGADMYDKVDEWIAEIAPNYDMTAAEMKEYIKTNLTFDRSIAEDANGNWRDIKSKSLFVKLRYSPMADYYFDVQTGPINLYFEQTGTKEIDEFITSAFDDDAYSSIPAALNDLLVAATKVLFPESANIGFQGAERGVVGTDLHVPNMVQTGNLDLTGANKAANITTSVNTLVSNALAMFEYAANAADPYIFNEFYKKHSITYTGTCNLTEENFEEAAIPLGIACVVQNVSLADTIHREDWDKVKDAEGAGFLALQEYLSYVLPERDYSGLITYDNDGMIVADFDTCILPMVRDAVGYVCQAFVPVRDGDGNEWNAYDSAQPGAAGFYTDGTNDLWTLANSVVCYYASDYKYPAVKNGAATTAQSKSVATLLGIADSSGNSLVQPTKTIWQNFDAVANKLLPVLGKLQYGTDAYAGQFNSYDLIYNDIIKGILDIGPNHGISNFLNRVYTICCSDPISQKGIDKLVYDDILVSFINNLFGPRYGKGYNQVLPTSSEMSNTASPFDSMLHVSNLGNYKGNGSAGTVTSSNELGYLSLLVANLYAALGGFDGINATGPKGAWTAAMFAATAVNSFIPDFTPQIGAHKFGATTASVENASVSGLTAAANLDTNYLNIKNGAIGINRAYNTTGRTDGSVVQDNRLYVKVTGIDVAATTNSSGTTQPTTSQISLASTTANIAPETTTKIAITGKAPSAAVGSILYTFTVHYNVTLGNNGTVLYNDLTTKTYMYHTTEKGWAETAYSGDVLNNNTTTATYTTVSSFAYYTPKDFIIPMSNPNSINSKRFWMKNTTTPLFGDGYKAMDGIFTYAKSGTKYYAVSNGSVASTQSSASGTDTTLAYAAIDRTTGDILNYDLYDYYYNGTWYRGTKNTNAINATVNDDGSGGGLGGGYMGYTATEIGNLSDTIKNSDGFSTRPHVVWTFAEALATGYVMGVDRSVARVKDDGTTEYIYNAVFVKPTTGLLQGSYGQSSKVSISWGTPVPGVYFGVGKNRLKKNTADDTKVFLKYDGSTELSKFADSVQIDMFRNNDEGKTTFNLYVADDTQAATLQQAYEADIQTMAAYQQSDLQDESIYDSLQGAFQEAVAEISKPINATNARTLGSTTIRAAVTGDSTNTRGDKAFKPVPTSVALPSKMLVDATKGEDGYWYNDEDCQLPIYYADAAHALTDADVTNGKDATGQAVVKDEETGTWYIANAPKYKQIWDTTSYDYPYQIDSDEQEKNGDNQLLYKQIQYVYRDNDGNKVNSTDDPTYKMPEGTTITKPNDGTEYRSRYEQLDHNLSYWMEQVKGNVKNAANRIVEGVSEDREGLNNVNYIVANYEAMVKVAKEAEALLKTEWNPVVTTDTTYQYDTAYYTKDGNDYKYVDGYKIGDPIEGTLYVYEPTYSTDASAVEISEAIRVYELYKSRADATHIAYQSGNRLENEIVHASGNAFGAYTATTDGTTHRFAYSTKDKYTSDEVANYTEIATTASTVRFGAVKDGKLVNEDAEGNKAYTDASWKAYIDALGAAVDTAKAQDEVSECYTAKSHLIIAENNLEEFTAEPEPTGYTVTGAVKVAKNAAGTTYEAFSAVKNATVNAVDANGDVVATATTDVEGKFSIEVPSDAVALKISKYCVPERTITLSGNEVTDYPVIPVVAVDYDGSGTFNAPDKAAFNTKYAAKDDDADLDGSGTPNAGDKGVMTQFKIGARFTGAYSEMEL